MTALDRLHQAEAAAREALERYENLAECSADYDPCAHEITGKLSDLLAALDAARGDVRQKVKDTLTDYLDHYPHPEFLDAVMAHFAPAAPPAAAVPEGYALVPVELTKAMREAFHDAHEEWEESDRFSSPDHEWAAMLAAAARKGE